MNKAVSFSIFIISGVVLSFLTGNIAVSIVGCSIVGLLINREIFSSGNNLISEIGDNPDAFLSRFQALKSHVIDHDYDHHIYEETVQDSVFIDAEGEVWSLELDTLDWYQLSDNAWTRAEPMNKMILVSETEFMEMEIP
jgi:hypothetical protein